MSSLTNGHLPLIQIQSGFSAGLGQAESPPTRQATGSRLTNAAVTPA